MFLLSLSTWSFLAPIGALGVKTQDVMRACVCVSVCDIMQKNIEKEFLCLESSSKQVRKHASRQARKQAGKQALGRHSVGAMPWRDLFYFWFCQQTFQVSCNDQVWPADGGRWI